MALHERAARILRDCGAGRRRLRDPLFEDTPPPRLGVCDLDDEDLGLRAAASACPVPGCRHASRSARQHEAHYALAHRHSCASCRRALPSPHLLDLHVQEAHDSFFAVSAQRKPSYCCYTEECKEKFWTAEDRFQHCVAVHKLPKDFRLEHTTKSKGKKKTNRAQNAQASDVGAGGDMCVDVQSEGPAPRAPPTSRQHFSFGHGKAKAFPDQHLKQSAQSGSRDTHTDTRMDTDTVVNDLRESHLD